MDVEKIKSMLGMYGIKPSAGLLNCIKISMHFLKKPTDVSKLIESDSLSEYCNEILEIWLPAPNKKQKKSKKQIRRLLPKSLKIISENYDAIKAQNVSKTNPTYEKFSDLFSDWISTCNAAKEKIKKDALSYANPFVTVSVGQNYNSGKGFQINAKLSSSIEGSWGNWIEKVLIRFNPKIIVIDAGRVDFILNSIAYDVKSGPRVYNAGQVDEAKAKRERILNLSKNLKFGKLIKIKDFQVAVVYGNENLADVMKDQGKLIIFGKDTWKRLTGDEWNSFRFFIWQIQFASSNNPNSWTRKNVELAVKEFVNSFYPENEKMLKKVKNDSKYSKFIKTLTK